MTFDYSLRTPRERLDYINNLLSTLDPSTLSNQYLTYMSDYILFVNDKNQTKEEKEQDEPILTRNREATVAKRQISYEEIIASLESGEDSIYAMISNDKNKILDPKEPITEEDISSVPGLREQLDIIESLKHQFALATGARKYSLKRQIIETWQQIYILKASFRNTVNAGHMPPQIKTLAHVSLDENITIGDDGLPHSDARLTLLNPAHVSFLLCYYSQLKQECYDDLNNDMHWILIDLENTATKALLPNHQLLYDLLIWKIDGLSNDEIADNVRRVYGEEHSPQYYSSVWRKQIPRLIAEEAQRQTLIWYYTNIEKGKWKKCGKCGQIKLAHPMFFSRNSSKDGFYSQCKECRNKK